MIPREEELSERRNARGLRDTLPRRSPEHAVEIRAQLVDGVRRPRIRDEAAKQAIEILAFPLGVVRVLIARLRKIIDRFLDFAPLLVAQPDYRYWHHHDLDDQERE